MPKYNDLTNSEAPKRFPSVSKLGTAILEYLISQVIGESAIDEIKKPYAEKQVFDSLSKAISRVEKKFLNQYPDTNAKQVLLQLPIHDLPSVQNEIWNFYSRPNDNGLEEVLVARLVELNTFDNDDNKKVVNAYLNILRREFVNINSELREKIQAIAILEIAEAMKQFKNLLDRQENEIKSAKGNEFKKFDTAQLILDGDFGEFGETKQNETVAILSTLLHIDQESVKILRVLPGSIIIEIELESTSLSQLALLVERKDYRLLNLGVIGLRLSNGNYISAESILQNSSASLVRPVEDKPMPRFGIIAALPKEYAAIKALLKNTKKYQISGRGAGHRYLLGEIPAKSGGKHIVVLALADMGNNLAGSRATQLIEHFQSVESIVMVGIAGGIPHPSNPAEHVRLGDIVVSNQRGVIQYDFTKETVAEIIHRNPPRPPSPILREGVELLTVSEIHGKRPWLTIIEQGLRKLKLKRPSEDSDILVSTEDPKKIISHPHDPRRIPGQPTVFTGPIASANILLKNPYKRDQLRDQFGVKAVEMEGSGIADATWNLETGYLVVRGICDYCDSNKGDDWQQYAAVVAAAYARVLIASLPVQAHSKDLAAQKIFSNEGEKHVVETSKSTYPEGGIKGRYKIIETLGQGKFGVVSKAYDKNINSYVAIKEIKFTGNTRQDREKFSKRFKREADALSRLTHPNIAKILDLEETRNSLYLITTYFPSGTLESRLGKPFPFNSAAGLLVPIGKALAYAHEKGFIHRDVKPSNILFTDTGEPILSDFGLVKSLVDENSSFTSEAGIFIGTPAYAAPEQWEGSTVYQSDIYALGVIFYEMVTGRNPLGIKNLTERLTNQYLDKPSIYVPNLPDVVDQVVLRATARRLGDRYESMGEFLGDLRKLAIEKIPTPTFLPIPLAVEKEESVPANEKTDVQKNKLDDEKLLSLVEKFEQEIKELILQKDFSNAKRLLKVVERFGVEGQQAAQRLKSQIH